MTTIGFIGLGIMGKPMAANLLRAGYSLHVYNRSRPAVDELVGQGASAASSPREAAESADVVITMLPDSPQVEEVALGTNGLIEGLGAGKIYIDMSSIHPASVRRIAAALSEKGVEMLDAPVSGGEIGAIEAKLAIMVGGSEAALERVRPILDKLGTSVTRVGGIGAGNTVKLINQIIVAVNIAAVSEGLALGELAGIDPTTVYEAIRGGLAGSRVLDTKIANIGKKQFTPGFRVELHEKDLRNALSFGEQTGADLAFAARVSGLFRELIGQGFGAEDHSALYRHYDRGGKA